MIRQTEAEVCIDRQADFIKMTISWEVKVKMRQVYESPKMFVQEFVPNEYVAACGDVNKIYRFVCNAGTYDTLLGYDVYTNGEDGKPGTWDDVYLGGYTPCDATHDASTTDEFIEGYMRKDYGLIEGSKIDVIIWRGPDGKNIHCTTNLNKNEWETAKS